MIRSRASKWTDHARIVGVAIAALWLTGCATIGPGTIPRDRFDYAAVPSSCGIGVCGTRE